MASASGSGSSLASKEKGRLVELEAKAEEGFISARDGFVLAGEALEGIRNTRLYRETHPSFDEYCEERWGFKSSRARQLIAAWRTVTARNTLGLPLPKSEWEARQMARDLRPAIEPPSEPEVSLVQHPLVAGLLPDITGDQWTSFTESIRRRGVVTPIILYEGMILDGWQRYRAASEVGQLSSLSSSTYEGDDPIMFWYASNVVRKHRPTPQTREELIAQVQGLMRFAEEARAMAAAEFEKAREELEKAREAGGGDEDVLAQIEALEELINQPPWVEEPAQT